LEIQIADELAKVVAIFDAHPVASGFASLFMLALYYGRKDGPIIQWFRYLGDKASKDAALENRRIEMMKMIEERAQMRLPGIDKEEDQEHR